MKVATTSEWKKWMRMQSTRKLPKRNGHSFPVFFMLADEWTVWHPYSDTYMVVDGPSYRAEWDKKQKGL